MKFLPTWIGVKNTIAQVIILIVFGFIIWNIPSLSGWAAVIKGVFMLVFLAAIFGLELEKWEGE